MAEGGRGTGECRICGKRFSYWVSEKPGHYCSECVQNEDWRTVPETPRGAENPQWNGGKIEKPCGTCGETIERYPSNFGGDRAFCSTACRSDWLSETFTGEGHPNWAGGPVGPYGPGWAAVRQAALERDDHACRICGRDRDDIGRNPDVHHIDPVRTFDDPSDAHRLENVISRCLPCHRRADAGVIARESLGELVVGSSEMGTHK